MQLFECDIFVDCKIQIFSLGFIWMAIILNIGDTYVTFPTESKQVTYLHC